MKKNEKSSENHEKFLRMLLGKFLRIVREKIIRDLIVTFALVKCPQLLLSWIAFFGIILGTECSSENSFECPEDKNGKKSRDTETETTEQQKQTK